jgi:hypothetical protein
MVMTPSPDDVDTLRAFINAARHMSGSNGAHEALDRIVRAAAGRLPADQPTERWQVLVNGVPVGTLGEVNARCTDAARGTPAADDKKPAPKPD